MFLDTRGPTEPERFENEGIMFLRTVGKHLASDALPPPTTPESKTLEYIADVQRNTKVQKHLTNDFPPVSTAITGEVSPPVPLQVLTALYLEAESSPLLNSI